jgi:hypothetical protein
MGFFDTWSDLVTAATPWTAVEAEAVSGGSSTEKTPAQKDDGGEGEAKVSSLFFWITEAYSLELELRGHVWRRGIWAICGVLYFSRRLSGQIYGYGRGRYL